MPGRSAAKSAPFGAVQPSVATAGKLPFNLLCQSRTILCSAGSRFLQCGGRRGLRRPLRSGQVYRPVCGRPSGAYICRTACAITTQPGAVACYSHSRMDCTACISKAYSFAPGRLWHDDVHWTYRPVKRVFDRPTPHAISCYKNGDDTLILRCGRGRYALLKELCAAVSGMPVDAPRCYKNLTPSSSGVAPEKQRALPCASSSRSARTSTSRCSPNSSVPRTSSPPDRSSSVMTESRRPHSALPVVPGGKGGRGGGAEGLTPDASPTLFDENSRLASLGVRVRVTGNGPTKGMPVLSAERQRGSSSKLGLASLRHRHTQVRPAPCNPGLGSDPDCPAVRAHPGCFRSLQHRTLPQ
eukprot:365436-Chlamydomonas_euryale.AAC.9